MTRRVIFVNRVYWPEEQATAQLLTDLAEGLAARGVEVHVICAPAQDRPDAERHRAVQIHRCGPATAARGSLFTRATSDFRFLRAAAAQVRTLAHPDDVAVVLTDPPLLGVAITRAVRARGAHVWHWVQDLYPEVAEAVAPGPLLRRLLRTLRPLRDRSWRQSLGVVAIGEDMADQMRKRLAPTTRIEVSANWSPTGLSPSNGYAVRAAWGVVDRFVVMYSGNLGRVHALDPIIELAARLQDEPRIVFRVIGHGPRRPHLETAARTRRLTNLTFLPPQPRDRLAATLSVGDLHLVTLRPGCEGTVWPSKFHGIVAVHQPVLFFGPTSCQLATLVRQHDLGGTFHPHEIEPAAAFVRALAHDPARRAALKARVAAFAAHQPSAADAVNEWHHRLASRPA